MSVSKICWGSQRGVRHSLHEKIYDRPRQSIRVWYQGIRLRWCASLSLSRQSEDARGLTKSRSALSRRDFRASCVHFVMNDQHAIATELDRKERNVIDILDFIHHLRTLEPLCRFWLLIVVY